VKLTKPLLGLPSPSYSTYVSNLFIGVSSIAYFYYFVNSFLEFQKFVFRTSPPLSPSPFKERGRNKKEGLAPLLNTPRILVILYEGGLSPS
jgi:hypothetical protein